VSEPDPLRAPELFSRDYAPPERPRRRFRWGLWLFLALLAIVLTPPAVVVALRWIAPPTTAFILQSPVQPADYVWVPAARHPQALRDAVIAAEDQKFYTHYGFDLEAIALALEHNQKSKRKRGASTITQQVAKNLFMWPSRSYLRKGLEASFTILLELCWPKERILEVYLNVAEFGPGTFGVEAAARKFFDKSAQELSPVESARLAAVLPNPRKWSAKRPGRYVQARTDWILAQIGHGPKPLPEPEPPALEAPVPGETPAETPVEPPAEMPSEMPEEPLEPQPGEFAEPDPAQEPEYTEPAPEGSVPGEPVTEPPAPDEPAEEPAEQQADQPTDQPAGTTEPPPAP
jgi:monofunctional biosynthetic peptidoglycan transglycosylase